MQDESLEVPDATPWKTIPWQRDRSQSHWLVWGIGLMLALVLGLQTFLVVGMVGPPRWFVWSCAASAGSAMLVWRLRASTPPAAVLGALICLKMLLRLGGVEHWTRTAVPELIALFLMTFLATRFARNRRAAHQSTTNPTERRGRRAAQVVANLGVAGLLANLHETAFFMASLAALAEATADTVSSEMGQALAGRTILITNLRRVVPGTDGGVSLAGTVLGVAAAAALASLAVLLGAVDGIAGTLVFVAGCGGLVVDSFLGATLERWGWLGNDLVNFASTAFAAAFAYEAARFLVPPLPFW